MKTITRGYGGLDAALKEVPPAAPVDEAEAPQLELILEDNLLGLPPLPAGSTLAPAKKRGIGRPPGARNRTSLQWVDFLRANYRDPAITLSEIQNTPVAELAARLGCTKLEALDRLVDAAHKLMPYFHSPQPRGLLISESRRIELVAGGDGDGKDEGAVFEGEAAVIEDEPPG